MEIASCTCRAEYKGSLRQVNKRMASSRARVVLRVRPHLDQEVLHSDCNIFSILDSRTCIVNSVPYSFDRIFTGEASQDSVFHSHFNEDVDNVLDGYNSTIIAFGQTAAGKSYTMTGGETDQGIIPRAVRRIFENQRDAVQMSYIEIYNEKLRDLFSARSSVAMFGNGTLKDAKLVSSSSAEGTLQLIRRGDQLRATATTKINNSSSRSHAVLSLELRTGARLILVDLAGSEAVKKTGASGPTLDEAACINKSLTSLAMVISALTKSRGAASHIPYRSSKLTQLLQGALGGNSRLSLIINCSPSHLHLSETLSSLRFGVRCKQLRNQVPSKEQREFSASLVAANEAVNRALQAWRLGIGQPQDEWLDLTEVYKLIGEEGERLPGCNSPRVDHDDHAEDRQKEEDAEIVSTDLEIGRLQATCDSLIARIRCIKPLIAGVSPAQHDKLDGCIEHQRIELATMDAQLAEATSRNELLKQELAIVKSNPISEKVRNYLQRLDVQMSSYAGQITCTTPPKRTPNKRPYSNELVASKQRKLKF